MNDTLKVIETRYSCRKFDDKPISAENLKAIADAGIQAPSAMNRQGWHISIVANKALLCEIEAEGLRVMKEAPDQSAYERILGRGGKLFYNAQAVVFIALKSAYCASNRYANVDLGVAAQNVSLAAASLGIGSCHCGMVSFCFAGGKAAEFKEKLKFPDGYECNYGVLLGYETEKGTPHAPDKSKISFID